MAVLSNVVIVGATGNLGAPILTALLADPSLSITILARPTSTVLSNPPSGAKLVTVDFDSPASLTAALKGADVLLLTIATTAVTQQTALIDAAVAAGVKRVIPSEFGADLNNPKTSALPAFAPKIEVRKYLEKLAGEGKIEWTAVSNGAFLDWGIKVGFLGVKVKDKTATLFDGGNRYFSASLLSDIAKAVIGVLKHPEETKNRLVYISSARVTQKELVAAYEKVLGITFEATEVSTEVLEKESYAQLAKGELSGFINQAIRALLGEGYGGDFAALEQNNELFGIKQLDAAGIEEVIKANV